MFKKPKKNFRTRQADDVSDEEPDDDVIIESFMPASLQKRADGTVPKKKKKKDKSEKIPKSKSASAILSFDHDEGVDAEEFKVKKSSHSRRVAKQLKREARREQEEAEKTQKETSTVPAYSEEDLKKLRQEQDAHNGIHPVDMDIGSDVEGGNGQVSDSETCLEEDNGAHEQRKRDPFGGHKIQDMISGGQIPDAAVIHMARKRRQQVRDRGDDFIPLEENAKVENTSRLVREDEFDRSEDEDEERMQFSMASHEQEMRKIQNTILAAEQGSDSEGSDYEREWEKQQIRKGVQAGVATQGEADGTTKQFQQYFFGNVPPSTFAALRSSNSNSPTTNIVTTRSAPPKNLPPITLEIIKKRLTDRLEDLTSVHRAHTHELHDIESRMENCSIDIDSQAGSKSGLEDRYRFFQQMRGYVRDLVDCLAEKMTSINFLDRCLMQQWKTRADKLVKRRQQDIKDQAHDFMPHKAGMPPPPSADPEEDLARQRRAAEREARRARRRRAREARSVSDHHDGMSTDDEENKSDSAKYQMERGNVRSSVQSMFEDTVEDFHDVDLIKSRFEQWQREQGETYQEAYIGLCLPKMFTPIIKLNLIQWNPLEEQCRTLEENPWFESLMFYGYREGQSSADSDLKLVPSVVEKIVILKLTAIVETIWDPLSTQQTKRLSNLVRKLVEDYPTITFESKNTQALMETVAQRIRKCLDDDVFVPLYPKQVLENKHSGSAQFFHRQLWTCVKLLCNIMEWQGLLADTPLQQLGLDFLLNRYMVLALHNSAINSENLARCQVITASFPSTWFSHLETESTIPQLENLCRHLVNAATSYGAVVLNAAESEPAKFAARESLKQIRKMLVTIHALDHASKLAEKFCIRS